MSSDNSSAECAQQIKRFEKLTCTNRDEWTTSDLKSNTVSIDSQGRKYYEFSEQDTKDFEEIKPYHDHLESTDPQRLQRLKAEHHANRGDDEKKGSGNWWYSCQYCGHGIIYPFKIKHVDKKLKMIIGSHCVKGFKNVDEFRALIQKRDEHTLRNAMTNWIRPICNQIWTDERLAERVRVMSDGTKKIRPEKKYRNYAGFLKSLNVNTMTYEELVAAFRKVDNYKHIQLPVYVYEIIHPQLAKKEASKTGLDEFFWS